MTEQPILIKPAAVLFLQLPNIYHYTMKTGNLGQQRIKGIRTENIPLVLTVGNSHTRYNVFGMIVHLTHPRHYVSVICRNSKWYLCNDEQITEMDLPLTISDRNAYVYYIFCKLNE